MARTMTHEDLLRAVAALTRSKPTATSVEVANWCAHQRPPILTGRGASRNQKHFEDAEKIPVGVEQSILKYKSSGSEKARNLWALMKNRVEADALARMNKWVAVPWNGKRWAWEEGRVP